MTIKEEIQIEEYKRTFAEAYKQGFIDAMNVYKTEPQKDLLVTEYPQDGEIYLIGRDKTEAVVMAYDVYKELTEAQTECKMPYEDCEDCETHLKAQYGSSW